METVKFVLLVQWTREEEFGQFLQFAQCEPMLEFLLTKFEEAKMNYESDQLTYYSASDFFAYIDSLEELVVLQFNYKWDKYEPKPKEWIKTQALLYLQSHIE